MFSPGNIFNLFSGSSLLLNTLGASTFVVYVIYAILAIAGTALMATLRPLEVDASLSSKRSEDNSVENLLGSERAVDSKNAQNAPNVSVISVLLLPVRERRLLFLLPLVVYSGVQAGFIYGDFTANYVKPTLGTDNIGYVMAVG